MTEEMLFNKVKEWGDKYSLQLDILSTKYETKLANGSTTFAANESSYACLSKNDPEYKTLVFSYRSLIVFAYENSLIDGAEAMILEPAFMVPPERKDAQMAEDILSNLNPKK